MSLPKHTKETCPGFCLFFGDRRTGIDRILTYCYCMSLLLILIFLSSPSLRDTNTHTQKHWNAAHCFLSVGKLSFPTTKVLQQMM